MSKILGFSVDEKQCLGLIKKSSILLDESSKGDHSS